MTDILVTTDIQNGIATVTIRREAAANALSQQLLHSLCEAVTNLSYNPTIRAVILTGAGAKAFCAGADLKERKEMSPDKVPQAVALIRSTIQAIADLPMPVIAAINGVAFGGGLELALACDFRIAVKSASMGLTETGLAIIPGAGGTQRLPRLIGVSKAKELIYTARRLDALSAQQIGLIDSVALDTDELMGKAKSLAEAIAQNGPIAVRQAKFAIDQGQGVDLLTGLRIEQKAYEVIIPTEDRLEGLQAFAEKRRPNYQGK